MSAPAMTPAQSRRSFAAGCAITGLIILSALLSFVWVPYDVTAIFPEARLAAPSMQHWLGANHLGRDVLSMLMIGAQVSITVAFAAVMIGLVFGLPLGLCAASFRGRIADEIIMRASDVVFAFPALIIAILLAAIFTPGAAVTIIAIGVFNIPVFARVTRGAALPVFSQDFILSARAAGKGRFLIAMEHVLPNIAPVLIVQSTVQFSMAVLAEAGLSYVGLGVQPPQPSWGRMLAESQTMIGFAPWLAICPGLAIFAFVLGLNWVGDGLRARLDPHERGASA